MNNSRTLTIKNVKFSGYYLRMNSNIWGDFQICISAPLMSDSCGSWVLLIFKTWVVISDLIILGDGSLHSSSEFSVEGKLNESKSNGIIDDSYKIINPIQEVLNFVTEDEVIIYSENQNGWTCNCWLDWWLSLTHCHTLL